MSIWDMAVAAHARQPYLMQGNYQQTFVKALVAFGVPETEVRQWMDTYWTGGVVDGSPAGNCWVTCDYDGVSVESVDGGPLKLYLFCKECGRRVGSGVLLHTLHNLAVLGELIKDTLPTGLCSYCNEVGETA